MEVNFKPTYTKWDLKCGRNTRGSSLTEKERIWWRDTFTRPKPLFPIHRDSQSMNQSPVSEVPTDRGMSSSFIHLLRTKGPVSQQLLPPRSTYSFAAWHGGADRCLLWLLECCKVIFKKVLVFARGWSGGVQCGSGLLPSDSDSLGGRGEDQK